MKESVKRASIDVRGTEYFVKFNHRGELVQVIMILGYYIVTFSEVFAYCFGDLFFKSV